jgi:hypothetical protein
MTFSSQQVAKAFGRVFGKLGHEREKKTPTEGDKHVVLLAPDGQC